LSSGRTKYPRKFFKKIETAPDKKNADAPKKVLPAEFCKKTAKIFSCILFVVGGDVSSARIKTRRMRGWTGLFLQGFFSCRAGRGFYL